MRPLTQREVDTLNALCASGCRKTAARALSITPSAIDAHVYAARAKLGASNSTMALLIWDRMCNQNSATECIAEARNGTFKPTSLQVALGNQMSQKNGSKRV